MRSPSTDLSATAFDQAAAELSTPGFAPVGAGGTRRRRVLESVLGLLFVAGVVDLGVFVIDQSSTSTTKTRGSANDRILGPGYIGPVRLPPVFVKPLDRTGDRIDGAAVLVKIPTGVTATVRANVYFVKGAPGRVRDTAIVMTRPGTGPAAAPWGTGSYYRSARVAISARVGVTSPEHRILSVTTPADLPPGVYPVLTVVRTVLLPGQPNNGDYGPASETSEIGVVVITPR